MHESRSDPTTPRPHDLLRLSDAEHCGLDDAPDWVRVSLRHTPWVVVRRATAPPGRLAVGVRGADRAHRYATDVSPDAVGAVVTPEKLAVVHHPSCGALPAYRALQTARAHLNGMPWGPTGSIGFQLATGAAAATPDSDLDLVIRVPVPRRCDRARLAELHARLEALPVRVDCQVETTMGAIALAELASEATLVMLRTGTGPRLIALADGYPLGDTSPRGGCAQL